MSTLQTNKHAQVVMEFLLMVGFSFFVILSFLIVILSISQANTASRTYDDILDFGKALQSEFLLASELEDGYIRQIDIPEKINGLSYNITIYDATLYTYMIINYDNMENYYAIPSTNGTLKVGKNYIVKNNTLYIK